MVSKTFFNRPRIFDGGMGQELIHRGLEPKGTLWSSQALIKKEYNQLVVEAHLDFINAGAEVIVTNTFASRKRRLIQNNHKKYFEKINKLAVKLALKARDKSKKSVLIAAGLPPQYETYNSDLGKDLNIISESYYEQASLLKENVDFLYLDVMASGLECKIAIDAIKELNLPVLVGVYIKDNGKLPSGENITEAFDCFKDKNILGVVTSCVSPQGYENVKEELKEFNIPYGFKVNAYNKIPENFIIKPKEIWDKNKFNSTLGINKELNEEYFFNFSKMAMNEGATILGGCCHIGPSYIKKISTLVN